MRRFHAKSILVAAIIVAGCSSGASDDATLDQREEAVAAADTGALTFEEPVQDDVLTKMFQWWNEAYKDPDGFTTEAFAQYFTDDSIMRINGSVRVRGVENLAEHFRNIQANSDKVVINLPFLRSFSSPDGSKIFTYHTIDAEADGKPSKELVMGYAELRDGKISVIEFLSVDGEHEPYASAE
ncbi:nuclear transport factor 2 family protein [Citromicrobium sp. JLT1363]|uniref:nuclear transport factor 2 family protein n=1 Tax=Citromicrobium sp. JLT1363 TaxID=517722 RepID=UPI000225E954|nr:nuclear transport factor 2 family protein [Citromicrobium sp. JLT1363]